jgi:hypothetical protein
VQTDSMSTIDQIMMDTLELPLINKQLLCQQQPSIHSNQYTQQQDYHIN